MAKAPVNPELQAKFEELVDDIKRRGCPNCGRYATRTTTGIACVPCAIFWDLTPIEDAD